MRDFFLIPKPQLGNVEFWLAKLGLSKQENCFETPFLARRGYGVGLVLKNSFSNLCQLVKLVAISFFKS